jgi:hypothetical protein
MNVRHGGAAYPPLNDCNGRSQGEPSMKGPLDAEVEELDGPL